MTFKEHHKKNADPTKLRVLSYNIHKGFNWNNSRHTLHEIKHAIDFVNADICCLQEIVGSENQLEKLADMTWPHFSYGKNAVFPNGNFFLGKKPNHNHGNAILSRYPIKYYLNHDISTNRFEKRGLLHCFVEIPSVTSIHVFNTHINLFEGSRKKQAKEIHRLVDESMSFPQHPDVKKWDHLPKILAGDFNDWTNNVTNLLCKDLKMHVVQFPDKKRPATFPVFFPMLYLDRIFYSGLKLVKMDLLTGKSWNKLSDHLPIFAEFEILDSNF